jgi:aminopeptidase N
MLHHFLGDAAFGAGLRDYLRRYAESNAAGADLWSALQTASDKPVVQFMDTWVTQGGYPLIQVALEGDSAASRLDCRQQRFYASPLVAPDPETLWPVPLVIRYEDSAGIHETNALLTERRQAVPLPVTGELAWGYANAGEVGFYRQQPDAALLSGLIAHLDRLAPGEQVGLLGDQWALVGSGHQGMGAFLDLLGTAVRGDHYQVLTEVVRHLHTLEDLLEEAGDTPALASFRTWVDRLFKDKMAGLGFAPEPGEARSRTLARVPVVDALTTLAHNPAALAEAQTWATREAADPASVDANLAPILVAATAQQGDAAVFERYVAIYQQRKAAGAAPQETDRYLHSFSKFEPPELTARTLDLLDTGIVPLEGMPTILGRMFERARMRRAAWEYVKAHWTLLETAVPAWIPGVVAITGQLPAVLRPDMVSFYEANLHGEARLSYAHALEELDQRTEFQARTRDDLLAWFHNRTG